MKSRPFFSKLRISSKSVPTMVACLVATLATAPAATLYWDATPGTPDGASDGGTGTWDTATANWDDGDSYELWNNGGNDTAVFAGTAGTVTIDTLDDLGVTVGGLTFGAANYIIAGATGETLTFGTAGDISNSGTATISAVIAGSATITKTGNGTLNLTAVNTFTGDTVISGGTLVVGGNNTAATLGPANYAGNITINGALLQFTNSTSQNFSGIISGAGNLHKGGSGTLTLSGANTYTGKTIIAAPAAGGPSLSVSSLNSVDIDDLDPALPLASSSLGAPTTVANGTIQLGSGTNVRSCNLIYTGSGETTDRIMNVNFNSGAKHTITSNATGGGLLKFTSNFTINPSSGTATGGLTLRGSGNGEIAQIGTIPGILEKADAGTWTVGGTNAANVVNVTTGTLIVNGTLTAKNATPSINVNGTSTLGGSGTLTATTAGTAIVTVAAGAKLTPGASVGTLTVDGTLNISAMAGGAGVINMDLGPIAASDKIAAGTLNIGTDVLNFADFNFTALGGLENGTYKLITSGAAVTGTLDPTPANLTGTIGAGPASGTLQISGSGTDIELVVSGVSGGSAYDTWASTNAPGDDPDEDFDGDGVTNAVEFLLGGDKDTNDLGKLPVAATDGTDMTFTFVRDQASIDAATSVSIEVSSDLVTWNTPPSPYAVPDADTAGVVNPGVTVVSGAGTDTVTLRVPQDSAKKFARLKVAIAP
jgi:fibronectin-binding autotransporter adhesin